MTIGSQIVPIDQNDIPTYSKNDLDLVRTEIYAQMRAMIDDVVKKEVEDSVKKCEERAMITFQEKADYFQAIANRHERIVGCYKGEVKELRQEISSMAHKAVEKEESELVKDMRILELETKMKGVESEKILDNLDAMAKRQRVLNMLKMSALTVISVGMCAPLLIEEGMKEHQIQKLARLDRYHIAIEKIEAQEKILLEKRLEHEKYRPQESSNLQSQDSYSIDYDTSFSLPSIDL